jgi:hypothetical protein
MSPTNRPGGRTKRTVGGGGNANRRGSGLGTGSVGGGPGGGGSTVVRPAGRAARPAAADCSPSFSHCSSEGHPATARISAAAWGVS